MRWFDALSGVRRRVRRDGRQRRAALGSGPRVEELERIQLLTSQIPTGPQTFIVNSNQELDGGYVNGVAVIADYPNMTTLREAIDCIDEQAQMYTSEGLSPPAATIIFDIQAGTQFPFTAPPGNTGVSYTNPAGPYDIQLGASLNPIMEPVTIDAVSMQGSTPGNPQVYLDGTLLDVRPGLDLEGGNSSVAGLGFINWKDPGQSGLSLGGGNGDTVTDCTFGIGPGGAAAGNIEDIFTNNANDTIGGTTAAARNIIANNNNGSGTGIFLEASGATNTLIEGNYIGTDPTGKTALGNFEGVFVSGNGNTIGGTTAAAANVISGNTYGIELGYGASNNTIVGNLIGTDPSGQLKVPNTTDGILITYDGADGNTIGGSAPGDGNVIAYSGSAGVAINSSPAGSGEPQSTGNTIEGNSIYGSGTLGIDLGNTGVLLPNGSGPNGPNDFQNYPVVQATSSMTITGTLTSAPGTYRIDYYANTLPSTPGGSPGQLYLGEQSATIGSSGSGSLPVFTTMVAIPTGATVTATATDSMGDTSEFGTTAPPPGLVVNETADEALNPDGTVATPGALSLREAIQMIEMSLTTETTISFAIPVSGVPVIALTLGALPTVTVPGVTINATTQPGGLVAVNGGGLDGDGLDLTGGTTTVEGLVIENFNGNGIKISGAGGDTVTGCLIGTDPTGNGNPADVNTGDGVLIENVANNMIGGTLTQIITGNNGIGVEISGSGATGNTVAGNTIGLDITGTAVSNGVGVEIDGGASVNTIGGITAAARNVISGNRNDGVEIAESASDNNVAGNYIGTGTNGQTASPNGTGVLITSGASNNVIGGTSTTTGGMLSGSGNVISANTGSGVVIQGAMTQNNSIIGNFIGTDVHGTSPLGNGGDGITVMAGVPANFIGASGGGFTGPLSGAGNLISGNAGNGIQITGAGATGIQIEGNYIGTDVTGTQSMGANGSPLGNGADGVQINQGAAANTVGGSAAGNGNLISNNGMAGVVISDPMTNNNVVAGNYIGTDVTGMAALGNGAQGVQITNGAASNLIGGASANVSSTPASSVILGGAGNVISGNADSGVAILPGNSQGSNNNMIQGDFIGTNTAGTGALGNHDGGLLISQSSNNLIGGNKAGTSLLISGNLAGSSDPGDGIMIVGGSQAQASGNIIIGDAIGVDVSRTKMVSNAGNGIDLGPGAVGNLIGTDASGSLNGNLISGNTRNGVLINGGGAANTTFNNVVVACYIGTNQDTSQSLPNTNGVVIEGGAAQNTIGGSAPVDANVISGNSQAGVVLSDPGTNHNQVLNNLIGTQADGVHALANLGAGLILQNQAFSNMIGAAGAGNVISGNGGDGVQILGVGTSNNSLYANMIGTTSHGSDLYNAGNGVTIQDASGNYIGGAFLTSSSSVAGQGNTISYNGGWGVVVSGMATGDSILNNVIYDNVDGGIHLSNPVVTPPVFGVTFAGTTLEDDAQVSGSDGQMFLVQFFSSDTRDPDTGTSQARSFLSSMVVTINAAGFFNIKLPGPAAGDTYILATATDANGNTSEFSMSTVLGSHTISPGFKSDNLEGIKSTIKSQQVQGKTASATIIISPTTTPADVTAAAAQAAKKGKSSGAKGGVHPTGTVIIEDGDTVLTEAPVKVVHGVSEAKVKLKFPTAGVQTLYVIYQPDAKSQQEGFNTSFTTTTVTVAPSSKKGAKGKTKAKAMRPAVAIVPAGPHARNHV